MLYCSLTYNFFIDLFIPGANYFNNKLSEINDLINLKFDGVRYLFEYINYVFSYIQTVPNFEMNYQINNIITNDVIDVNFFQLTGNFTNMFRLVSSALICIITVNTCYKKLIVMFD